MKLFVPEESIEAYKADAWWGGFKEFYPTGKSLVQFVD